MDALDTSRYIASMSMTHAEDIVPLLKKGLEYIQQGRDAEGIALFELGRKQLLATQTRIANVLDIFMQNYVEYQLTCHTLQEASVRFATAYAEQQMRVTAFAEMLPMLLQEIKDDSVEPKAREKMQIVSSAPPNFVLTSHLEQTTLDISEHERDTNKQTTLPTLTITCFGHFEVIRAGKPLTLCSSRKGQSILRYLVAQQEHSATIDTLMTLLWPDEESEVAQSKLHIAISALRRSLNHGYPCEPGTGYIICKNRVYALNPEVSIQTDVEQFVQAFRAGRHMGDERIAFYERACRLYTGPFLCEDIYADWSFLQREQLSQMYLTMCRALTDHALQRGCYEDAITWITAILKENRCDESAHCQLMRVYMLQGRRSEAIQQYQRCECILREELGIQPLPETTNLFHTIFTH